MSRQKISSQQYFQILKRIRYTVYKEDLEDCDFIIEAITEKFEEKSEVLRQIEALVKSDAIIASNTSSISINKLGGRLSRPENFMGMHFFNPVPVMKLVEMVVGVRTGEQTKERVKGLAELMGKSIVTAKDSPGFITNRVLMPWINEAVFCLQEGVASAKDIDKAMRLGTNTPMGPLQLADFIGLDTVLFILEVLFKDTGD